jgi:hypothetical protein
MLSSTVENCWRILLINEGELLKCSYKWRTGNTKRENWVIGQRD